jgi:hypothetical protein
MLYETSSYVFLLNGDRCDIGQYVIVREDGPNPTLFVACVREIIQQVNSPNHTDQKPDGILLQMVDSNVVSPKFQMPELALQELFSFVPIDVSHVCDILELR